MHTACGVWCVTVVPASINSLYVHNWGSPTTMNTRNCIEIEHVKREQDFMAEALTDAPKIDYIQYDNMTTKPQKQTPSSYCTSSSSQKPTASDPSSPTYPRIASPLSRASRKGHKNSYIHTHIHKHRTHTYKSTPSQKPTYIPHRRARPTAACAYQQVAVGCSCAVPSG